MPFCVDSPQARKMEETRRGSSMSLLSAEGLLTCISPTATVVLAKASPDDYEVISSFKVPHTEIVPLVASHDCRWQAIYTL